MIAREKNKRVRENLLKFVEKSHPNYQAGWVHQIVCDKLQEFSEKVVRQESPRLMIFMPPRHGKSFIASERFPVWHLGRNPTHQILVTSYGQTLSDKFSKRARSLASTPYIKEIFTNFALHPDRQTVQEWETTQEGGYRSVGIGGGVTGMGCNILIIDDPIKNIQEANSRGKRDNDWDWYTTTAYTRGMPGFGILVIQTRWHPDDLSGRLLEAMKNEDGDTWEMISFPAIAEVEEVYREVGEALHPERYDLIKLKNIRKAIGSQAWGSLYQQRPVLIKGEMFKRDWWKRYNTKPSRFDRTVISWDCAFKGNAENDYVVGHVWGSSGGQYYLLNSRREKADFLRTCEMLVELAELHPTARPILVEDTANGPAVMSFLKDKIKGLLGIRPDGSKEARATVITPLVEQGRVLLPENELYVDPFIEEAAQFPRSVNDDQVDAFTQAITYLEQFNKDAVFFSLFEIFGSPQAFHEGDYFEEDVERTTIFGGVYFDRETADGAVVCIDREGKIIAVASLYGSTTPANVARIKLLAPKEACFVVDDSGHGETLYNVIVNEPWSVDLVKQNAVDIDEMFMALKDTKDLKYAPSAMLFDQMSLLRSTLSEKGTVIYDSPEGLTCPAAWALALAYRCYEKNKDSVNMTVGVIDEWALMQKMLED